MKVGGSKSDTQDVCVKVEEKEKKKGGEEKKIFQILKIHSANFLLLALFQQNQEAEYLSLVTILNALSYAKRGSLKTF